MDDSPRRRRKQARPGEILSAAFTLFAERGFAATKMDDIARAAGVSRGTPYLYFSSKEELFKSLLREQLVPLLDQGRALLDEWAGLPAAEQLRRLLHTWWQLQGEGPFAALPKLIIAESGNFPEVAEIYRDEFVLPGDDLIRCVIERGMASGEFRQVDVEYVLHVICAPVVMAMVMRNAIATCLPHEFDPERYVDALCDLVLHGLKA